MTRDEELESLKAKLAASQQMGIGYADRIKAIEARIAELSESDDDEA
jgi:hypothetical protein